MSDNDPTTRIHNLGDIRPFQVVDPDLMKIFRATAISTIDVGSIVNPLGERIFKAQSALAKFDLGEIAGVSFAKEMTAIQKAALRPAIDLFEKSLALPQYAEAVAAATRMALPPLTYASAGIFGHAALNVLDEEEIDEVLEFASNTVEIEGQTELTEFSPRQVAVGVGLLVFLLYLTYSFSLLGEDNVARELAKFLEEKVVPSAAAGYGTYKVYKGLSSDKDPDESGG